MTRLHEAYYHYSIEKDDKLGSLGGMTIEPKNISGVIKRKWGDGTEKKRPLEFKKLSTIKGLDLYRVEHDAMWSTDIKHHYILHDPKTNMVHLHVDGSFDKEPKTLNIGTLGGSGQSPVKAPDLYAHILKKGYANALVGKGHSEGGVRVWQKLAKKRNISVHGWKDNRPVNLDPQNRDETHSTGDYYDDGTENEIMKTKLVASYHKKLAQKIKQIARETS
jgi:hypothetical protein